MIPTRHVIRHQLWELTVPGQEQVHALQEEVLRIFHARAVPAMDRVLSALVDEDEVIRLERIDLDLGVLAPAHLEEELPRRLEAELEKVLSAELGSLRQREPCAGAGTGARVLTAEAARLEWLRIFLETGSAPWWVPEAPAADPESVLAELLEASPMAVAEMLRRIAGPRVAGRLAKQFSPALRRKLLARLAGSRVEAVERAIADWERLLAELPEPLAVPRREIFASRQPPPSFAVDQLLDQLLGRPAEPDAGPDVSPLIIGAIGAASRLEPAAVVQVLAPCARRVLPPESEVRIWIEKQDRGARPPPRRPGDRPEAAGAEQSATGKPASAPASAGPSPAAAQETSGGPAEIPRESAPAGEGVGGLTHRTTRSPSPEERAPHSDPLPLGEQEGARVHSETDARLPPQSSVETPVAERRSDNGPKAARRQSVGPTAADKKSPSAKRRPPPHARKTGDLGRDSAAAAAGEGVRSAGEGVPEAYRVREPALRDEGVPPAEETPRQAPPPAPMPATRLPAGDQGVPETSRIRQGVPETSRIRKPVTWSQQARPAAETPAPAAPEPVPRASPAKLRELLAPDEGLYVDDAGLVIPAPYLPAFFRKLGLVDDRAFRSEQARERAVLLLRYLATGEAAAGEHLLALDKLLCGWPLAEPVAGAIDPTPVEQEESTELLASIIRHWEALKRTSVDGLRASFLQRQGRLTEGDQGPQLQVARSGYDLLLDQLPWSIGMVLLPWMDRPLFVEW